MQINRFEQNDHYGNAFHHNIDSRYSIGTGSGTGSKLSDCGRGDSRKRESMNGSGIHTSLDAFSLTSSSSATVSIIHTLFLSSLVHSLSSDSFAFGILSAFGIAIG